MAKKNDKKKEAARIMREQKRREETRKKILLGGGITLSVLLLAGVLGLALWLNHESFDYIEPEANHTEEALIIGDGPVVVDIFEDYMCPACGEFEEMNGPIIEEALASEQITLNVRPIAALDQASAGTSYSSRAAAAAVCAADQDMYQQFSMAMYQSQPEQGTEGPSNDEIAQIGAQVGLDESFASCVEDDTYRGWVAEADELNQEDEHFTGTPSVVIDGNKLEESGEFANALSAAIEEAGGELEGEDPEGDEDDEGEDDEADDSARDEEDDDSAED